MQQKATVPIIVVAVVVVVGLLFVMGKKYLGGQPTNTGKTVYPSFIDPATGKPKAGMGSTSGETAAPATRGGDTSQSGGAGGR